MFMVFIRITCTVWCRCVLICAAGITLPDDIQFSLTADEDEQNAEVGSSDGQQSASRMNEAGCVSFLHCPAHDQSDA